MFRTPSYSQIINTIDNLQGIIRESRPKGEWLDVLCPFHNDKHLGNAFININTSVFKCFSCGKSSNLVGMVKHHMELNYTEAVEFIGLEENDNFQSSLNQRKNNITHTQVLEEREDIPTSPDNITTSKVNSDEIRYLFLRGYTEDYIRHFNIKVGKSGWYKDYLITPIKDRTIGLDIFEARKVKEYEYLRERYSLQRVVSEEFMKERLYTWIEDHNVKYKKGKLYIRGEVFEDNNLLYLMRAKVLYPSNSKVNRTIFNYDNLNKDEDLWITEGLASNPKIWTYISQNVTSIFGANLTDMQIQLLEEFKGKKIFIPDNDTASDKLLWRASQNIRNCWVVPITSEDTDDNFVEDIKMTRPIEATRFLLRKSGLLNQI